MTSNGTGTGTACHNCGERAGWRDDDQGVPLCMDCVITHGGGRRHSILPTEIAPGVVEAFEPECVSLGPGALASIAGEPSYAPTAAEGFPARPIPPIGPETGTEGPQRATGVAAAMATAMDVTAGLRRAGAMLEHVASGKPAMTFRPPASAYPAPPAPAGEQRTERLLLVISHASDTPAAQWDWTDMIDAEAGVLASVDAVDLEHDQADDPQTVWDEIDQAWTDAPDAFACGDAFGCAVETGREQAKRLAEALATIARLTKAR